MKSSQHHLEDNDILYRTIQISDGPSGDAKGVTTTITQRSQGFSAALLLLISVDEEDCGIKEAIGGETF